MKIMAILAARPGKAEELEALLSGMAPACRVDKPVTRMMVNSEREANWASTYIVQISAAIGFSSYA